MKSRTLSKSDIKSLNKELERLYNIAPLGKKDSILLVESNRKYLKVNNKLSYFYYNNLLIPTLHLLSENCFLKKIIIDMGSIKFLCSGADLMRPGIVDISEDIKAGDIIVAVDVNNHQPIMVGEALLDSNNMKTQEKGKSVKNIHFVGDEIWNA